ncbi:MAG: phosphomannomutase/phosphoglucomutase [Aggregatilineales bacterium]
MPLDAAGQFVLSRAYSPVDIRGAVGTEVQPEDGRRLGRAVACWLERAGLEKRVVVGGDHRLSTPALKAALLDGLLSAGCHVLDLGTVPTPAFFLACKHYQASGVQVTASHNPPGDNGFKVQLGPTPNTEAEFRQLWALVAQGASGSGSGIVEPADFLNIYLARLRASAPRLNGLRVVVDAGNGVCGPFAASLFRGAGAQADALFSEPDGRFPNRSPDSSRAASLIPLGRRVVETGAALGIAYDGDGDRAGFTDELGRPLGSDAAFVLFIRYALRRQPGVVIYDIKCSDIVPREVRAMGGTPVMEKTGHAYIKRSFVLREALLAGELTGHFAFREWGTDDGMYASLVMARIVRALDCPLSAAVDAIPRYHITPDIRIRMDAAEIEDVLETLRSRLADEGEVITLDGVRAQFADGWGLARASITAPELTLRFEGYTEDGLRQTVQRFVRACPALAPHLAETPEEGADRVRDGH